MKNTVIGGLLVTTLWIAPAIAADMAIRAPARAVVSEAIPQNWSGFYAGIHAGYGWGRSEITELVPYAFCNTGDPCRLQYDFNGAVGGVHVGYNWQAGALVLGLEADFSLSGMKERIQNPFGPVVANESFSTEIDWFGTGRARLGYAGAWGLIYATGGFAYARIENRYTDPPDSAVGSGVKWGWTVGAGAEFALNPSWTIRAEYLFVDLQNTNGILLNFFRYDWENHFHITRLGLSYRFGGSPVVARY